MTLISKAAPARSPMMASLSVAPLLLPQSRPCLPSRRLAPFDASGAALGALSQRMSAQRSFKSA